MTLRRALFDGDPLPLPVPTPRAMGLYSRAAGRPDQVRHARGYERFVAFVEGRAQAPASLAANVSQLVDFIQQNSPDIVADPALSASAARFLGNAIALLRADTQWHTFEDGTMLVGNRWSKFDVDILLTRILGGDTALGAQVTALLKDWNEESDARDAERMPAPEPVFAPLSSYSRPALPATVFTGPNGAAIRYGDRWPAEGPPADSYGAESNLERFAPLQLVAEALVAYLLREYQVTISEDLAYRGDLVGVNRGDVARAIRVAPARNDAAPLTFVFTTYPGVIVHAGMLHDFRFPDCGCDACDETAESQAGQMERLVMAVAAGGYREQYPIGRKPWSSYVLIAADGSGSESGEGDVGHIPAQKLLNASERLNSLPNGWQPWPQGSTAGTNAPIPDCA